MKFGFLGHGILRSSASIFHTSYLIDNKAHTKACPKRFFGEGLVCFSNKPYRLFLPTSRLVSLHAL